LAGEWTQARGLARVSEVLEQIAEPTRSGVLVDCGSASELPRIGARAKVVHDLCGAIETGSLMEVPHGVEKYEFDARYLGKSGIGLQLAEPRRLVDGDEGFRRLIHELDPLSIDRDGAKLLRDDRLEDLGGLMRGAVKRRGAQQRDPVINIEMANDTNGDILNMIGAGLRRLRSPTPGQTSQHKDAQPIEAIAVRAVAPCRHFAW
jgi:hypothetical protein